MRPILLLLATSAFAFATPLEVVKPIIAQSEGGASMPPGFQHVAGETLYFSCRVAGWVKTPEEKVHVSFSVQAFDPNGVPLTEIYKNELVADVSPQDKEWMPKIYTEIQVPPLVASGTYKVVVKAEDLVGRANAELAVPFGIRGKTVEPSDTLTVRNVQFYRGEDDPQPLAKPAYRGGDAVWTKFDITGFKYGKDNHIDISYVTSVISPSGKVLWTQPEPAVERSESFYPKRYVAASMGINLLPNTKPGEYTIAVMIKDGVGGQSYEARQTFLVE